MQALQEEQKAADVQFHSLHLVLKLLKEQNHKLVKHGQVRLSLQLYPTCAGNGVSRSLLWQEQHWHACCIAAPAQLPLFKAWWLPVAQWLLASILNPGAVCRQLSA